MKLAENAGSAEHQHNDANDRRDDAMTERVHIVDCFRDGFRRRRTYHRFHLRLNVTDGIAAINEADERDDDDEQRRHREDRVIRQRGSQAGSLIGLPFVKRFLDDCRPGYHDQCVLLVKVHGRCHCATSPFTTRSRY